MKAYNKTKTIPWDLILKELKNIADEDEKNRLNAWIVANDQCRRMWNDLQQAWNEICELNSEFNPDSSLAWQQIVEKVGKQYEKPAHTMSVRRQVAAACILLLVGAATGFMFKTFAIRPVNNNIPVAWTQYETQYGKSLVILPDGTQVWLNARSNLKYSNRFNQKERKVELQGEAFFDVIHNPDIPFLVDTKNMQVSAHGTKFNVQAYDNKAQTSVALIDGVVTVVADGHLDTHLEPGYSATYNRKNNKLVVSESDEYVSLWANKELRIENKSLEEAASLLEKWYQMKINVSPELKSGQYYTFTVWQESPAELLAAMQKIGNFKYKIEEQEIRIY